MLSLIANWKRIIYGTALATLGALLLVQTARIEGFLFWDGLKAENARLSETLDKVKAAQAVATRIAQQEKARIEAENERKAENAKADFEKRLAANNAALRSWLQNHRRAAGSADLPETSQATGGLAETSAAPVIPENYALVPIADLELSAEAFAKLASLQEWARSIGNQSNQPIP